MYVRINIPGADSGVVGRSTTYFPGARVFVKYENGDIQYMFTDSGTGSNGNSVLSTVLMCIFTLPFTLMGTGAIVFAVISEPIQWPLIVWGLFFAGVPTLMSILKIASHFNKGKKLSKPNSEWIEITNFEYDHITNGPAEEKCSFCGGKYIKGSTSECPHCHNLIYN